MAISTINQAGLNAPLTLTSPVLTTPNLGTPSAVVLTNATSVPVNQATGTLPVANGGTGVTGGPIVMARLNDVGAYGSTDNAWTKPPYDTKDIDTNNFFNATGSTVTLNGLSVPSYSFCPNIAGYYLINGTAGFYSLTSGTGRLVTNIFKNGVISNAHLGYIGINYSAVCFSGATIIYLNGTGDYASLYANQNNGGTRPFDYSAYNVFYATLIRKA